MSSLIEYPSLRTQNVYQDAVFSENRDTTRWHASTGVPLRVSSRVGSPARPGERGTPRFLWEGGTDFIIAQNSLEPEWVNVIAHPFAERQFGSYCHVAHALAQNKMPYTHTHTHTNGRTCRSAETLPNGIWRVHFRHVFDLGTELFHRQHECSDVCRSFFFVCDETQSSPFPRKTLCFSFYVSTDR